MHHYLESLVCLVARTLHIDTPDNQDYNPMWLKNGRKVVTLVFRVKAASDATVYLGEIMEQTDAYQIVIGGHTNTMWVNEKGLAYMTESAVYSVCAESVIFD